MNEPGTKEVINLRIKDKVPITETGPSRSYVVSEDFLNDVLTIYESFNFRTKCLKNIFDNHCCNLNHLWDPIISDVRSEGESGDNDNRCKALKEFLNIVNPLEISGHRVYDGWRDWDKRKKPKD